MESMGAAEKSDQASSTSSLQMGVAEKSDQASSTSSLQKKKSCFFQSNGIENTLKISNGALRDPRAVRRGFRTFRRDMRRRTTADCCTYDDDDEYEDGMQFGLKSASSTLNMGIPNIPEEKELVTSAIALIEIEDIPEWCDIRPQDRLAPCAPAKDDLAFPACSRRKKFAASVSSEALDENTLQIDDPSRDLRTFSSEKKSAVNMSNLKESKSDDAGIQELQSPTRSLESTPETVRTIGFKMHSPLVLDIDKCHEDGVSPRTPSSLAPDRVGRPRRAFFNALSTSAPALGAKTGRFERSAAEFRSTRHIPSVADIDNSSTVPYFLRDNFLRSPDTETED
jgi:hypothetical protein